MTAVVYAAVGLPALIVLVLLARARRARRRAASESTEYIGRHRRTAKPGTREAALIDMTTVHDIPVMAVTPASIDELRDRADRIHTEVTA